MPRTRRRFNPAMHQINIASIDVLMQLVQLVEGIRENQRAMQAIIAELAHRNGDDVVDSLEHLRTAMNHTDSIANDLPDKLSLLVSRLNETIDE